MRSQRGKNDMSMEFINSAINNAEILERIEQIANLKDNWDGYGAVPPSKKVINRVISFINSLSNELKNELHFEEIVPSPYGTVSIEWSIAKYFVSIEIGEEQAGFYSLLPDGTEPYNDNLQYPLSPLPNDFYEALLKLLKTNI